MGSLIDKERATVKSIQMSEEVRASLHRDKDKIQKQLGITRNEPEPLWKRLYRYFIGGIWIILLFSVLKGV